VELGEEGSAVDGEARLGVDANLVEVLARVVVVAWERRGDDAVGSVGGGEVEEGA